MNSSIEIPEGLLDCINGGDSCPFENLKQFRKWIRKNTGIKVDIKRSDIFSLLRNNFQISKAQLELIQKGVEACLSGAEVSTLISRSQRNLVIAIVS